MSTPAKQITAGAMIYFTTLGQVFGQAALLPNAEQQFFDNNGHPLASGSVQFYVPGTSTPKTTWQNSAQTINNQNPVSLDIGGKAILYGQGSYRQIVRDVNGNTIWDLPTTAVGSSAPSGATGTDTAPVGTMMPYGGFVAPTNWQFAYGQALSRTLFSDLMAAITIQATGIGCVNTSTTLTGFTDTSLIRVGAPIEATCLPTSTTVASITNATTIVVSQAAAATSTVTATIFPWGNGDQVSTFNVPDLRGRSAVGADCMGYVASGNTCAGNLTTTFYGANPGAGGQTGGTQSKTLTLAQLPTGITSTGSISTSGTVTVNPPPTDNIPVVPTTINSGTGGGGTGTVPNSVGAGSWGGITSLTGSNTLTGTANLTSNNTSGSAFGVVNPDATVNYIIKVTPNNTGAGGVVSFGGMFGDIVCDLTMNCAPVASVNTIGVAGYPNQVVSVGTAVNFNATNTDTSFSVPLIAANYRVDHINVGPCSAANTTATFALWTGAGDTGTQILNNTTGTVSTASVATSGSVQIVNPSISTYLTGATLFFRNVNPQGTAVTCHVSVVAAYLP